MSRRFGMDVHWSRPGAEQPRRAPTTRAEPKVEPDHAPQHGSDYFDPLVGPFSPAVNGWLSRAFERPLAGLELVRGLDPALRDAGAEAATVDRRIALGSHLHADLSDPRSMGVIAHEVAHALGSPGPRAGVLDRPGDPGESRAHQAGEGARQSLERGGPPPRLRPADGGRAAVHRFNVYFALDPKLQAVMLGILSGIPGVGLAAPALLQIVVDLAQKHSAHEAISALALKRHLSGRSFARSDDLWGGIHADEITPGNGEADPASMGPRPVQDLVRGVRVPDDPRGDLHGENANAATTANAWYLLRWGLSFARDKVETLLKINFPIGIARDTFWMAFDLPPRKSADLTYQSHNGVLQNLHAMQPSGVSSPATVKKQVMDWAMFLVDVAQGRRGLSDRVPPLRPWIRGVQALFEGHHAGLSEVAARRRAVGALFHLIQDSYAGGHTSRTGAKGEGDIRSFADYAKQDHDKHAAYDKLAAGKTLEERIHNTRGAEMALQRCTELLERIESNASRDELKDFLENQVFRMAP